MACTAGQQQLCTNDNDCQGSGAATCVNGFCTDPTLGDGGVLASDVYVPPLDGSVTMPGTSTTIPAGYPAPTAANSAMCQTTTMLANGLCPGGGAGPVCIQCLFGGTTYNNALTPAPEAIAAAGNYVVTVQLGGATAGQTFVSAESSRGILAPISTTAGKSVEYAFVVNVRAMEGQPNHAGGPGGYPGLDLFFSGPTATPPQIGGIGYALATAATKPLMVYIAGDSTVCDQTGNLYGGWGQMLPEYLGPPVGIANYANSGASSGSYGPYWSLIKAKWTAGDWVMIQFGHNDKGVADSVVQANLTNFLSDALAAGVNPIVVSPPARVQFSGNVIGDQSSLHAAAAKAAAAAKKVPYIDLTTLSTAWYNSLGSQAAAMKFHVMGDATHTNLAGAGMLAGLVAGDIKAQNLPLAKYLR
ncbi:MAG: GDSL-type esterase/lipase family protein [Myxococcota bacterium]|nr:GDSL-type esterase/lipase family protein [Myxococcota bacterium]